MWKMIRMCPEQEATRKMCISQVWIQLKCGFNCDKSFLFPLLLFRLEKNSLVSINVREVRIGRREVWVNCNGMLQQLDGGLHVGLVLKAEMIFSAKVIIVSFGIDRPSAG